MFDEAVADVRAFLRMGEGVEQVVLERFVGAAVGLGEQFTGTPFLRRQVEELVEGEGWRRLRYAPVAAITGVTARPLGAAARMLSVDEYAVDIDPDGVGWVRIGGVGAVTVSYVAGLAASWAEVPAAVAQGVTSLAAHLFEHREGGAAPPAAVAALWRPYRRMTLGAGVRT